MDAQDDKHQACTCQLCVPTFTVDDGEDVSVRFQEVVDPTRHTQRELIRKAEFACN